MTVRRLSRFMFTMAGVVAVVSSTPCVHAQSGGGVTFDAIVPPGTNYDTAQFRLWYPKNAGPVRAVVLLVPGSGEDGRDMVDDTVWQAFATRHQLALVGCYITDHPHPLDFVEEYANVSKGSGQALVTALTDLAGRSKHPEIAGAPLLLWGISAGGEFNYEFVAWKPERVLAFVVNKGGIYYTALMSPASRAVPGLLFVGGKDLEFRTNTIVGLFALNRRAGALWALTEEYSMGHDVGRSRELATMFFEDVLALRLNDSKNPATLTALTEQSGFLGDLKAKTVQPLGNTQVPNYPTAWLPTERIARAWRAVVTETPFDSSGH
jgi:poly(3-hydroxybutyrate) depolymerase